MNASKLYYEYIGDVTNKKNMKILISKKIKSKCISTSFVKHFSFKFIIIHIYNIIRT